MWGFFYFRLSEYRIALGKKKGHVHRYKSDKVNQELDSQSFSFPDDEAREEHDDHPRLDRTYEHRYGFGPEEFYVQGLEIQGVVIAFALDSIPAIDHGWSEHAEGYWMRDKHEDVGRMSTL